MSALSAKSETLAGTRRTLAETLRSAGIETPDLDARALLAHALSMSHATLASAPDRALSQRERETIDAMTRRRLAREPVARIVGEKEFWSLPLLVSADTLVPRPDTEIVVEAALDALRGIDAPRIADIGTGSGVILLALLSERQDASGIGTDISAGAIATARANAQRLGLHARAQFIQGNLTAPLRGPFHCIASNPPYVKSGDIAALAPDVRDHDPHRALDGGPDGLSFYRELAREIPPLLSRGGVLVVEIGAGQESDVTAIMSASGLTANGPARQDLAGIARALILRRLP